MPDTLEKPESWQNVSIRFCETILVLTIALCLFSFVCFEFWWNFLACNSIPRPARMEMTLKMLHENWKAGLLVLIPLFYRPIRTFAEKLKKMGSLETREPEEEPEKTANPQQSPKQGL